jgi:hypothetical protein
VANQDADRHHAGHDRRQEAHGRDGQSRARKARSATQPKKVEEIGGPPGPEPTRYGDWQFNGKVTDF